MPAPAKSPLRLGLIGCGHIARTVHIPILQSLPQAELVAVAEPERQRREDAARQVPGAEVREGYLELLQMPTVDAVLICLPTALHAEVAEDALHAGKHIYLEKPVAMDVVGARRVLDAWKQADTVGMIGFNYRFNPLYQEARRCIEAGRLGEVIAVRSVFAAAPHTLPDWKRSRQTGGGALLDLASHHADLLHFFFGHEVAEVSCHVRSLNADEDSAILGMRLANGLLAQTFVSLSAAEEDRFEIYGERAKLTVDRFRSVRVEISGLRQADSTWRRKIAANWDTLRHSPYRLQKRMAIGYEPSYQRALAHFVTAACAWSQGERRAVSPDLEDGCRSLAVIVAAHELVRTGHSGAPVKTFYESSSCQ